MGCMKIDIPFESKEELVAALAEAKAFMKKYASRIGDCIDHRPGFEGPGWVRAVAWNKWGGYGVSVLRELPEEWGDTTPDADQPGGGENDPSRFFPGWAKIKAGEEPTDKVREPLPIDDELFGWF